MMRCKLLVMLIALACLSFSAPDRVAAQVVGYANVIIGQPRDAFTIKRADRVVPAGDYMTDILAGDLIVPASNAAILFVPADYACPEVMITEPFQVVACPSPHQAERSFIDPVKGWLMADPDKVAELFTTRGEAEGLGLFSLAAEPLRLRLVSPTARAENELLSILKNMPHTVLAGKDEPFDVLVKINSDFQVDLDFNNQRLEQSFKLPDEADLFRQKVMALLNYKIISSVGSGSGQSPIAWEVRVYAPTDTPASGNNGFTIKGQPWAITETVKVDNYGHKTRSLRRNEIISFALRNNGDRPYYIYVLNHTERGDIKVLVGNGVDNVKDNHLTPGQSLSPKAKLRLSEPVEELLLIVSEHRLDLEPLVQNGFNQDQKQLSVRRARPLPPKDWNAARLTITTGQE